MSQSPITSLRLQHVRSYDDFAIELSPYVNIVVGPNASGKTNLLESILLASGVGSYRATYAAVVRHECDWARIDMDLGAEQRSLKIQKSGDLTTKTYVLHGVEKRRLGSRDIVPVVLFEPEHMRLLTGSPELRRTFIDDIAELLVPGFGVTRRHYIRTLAQRNKLLKGPHMPSSAELFAWNIRLAELAGTIVKERSKLIATFNESLTEVYSEIARDSVTVRLEYMSPLTIDRYESELLHRLDTGLQTDVRRGFTGFGPHREDITVLLSESPASLTASRGETRTLVLSLKAMEIAMIQQACGVSPVVLLDDVFSELDGVRRSALTHQLKGVQTIITTTDADVVAKSFAQTTNLISLG